MKNIYKTVGRIIAGTTVIEIGSLVALTAKQAAHPLYRNRVVPASKSEADTHAVLHTPNGALEVATPRAIIIDESVEEAHDSEEDTGEYAGERSGEDTGEGGEDTGENAGEGSEDGDEDDLLSTTKDDAPKSRRRKR